MKLVNYHNSFLILIIMMTIKGQVIKSLKKFTNPSCLIDINEDSASNQPLYIRPGTNNFFHPTNRNGFIEMDFKEKMEVFCEQFNYPSGFFGVITIECYSGKFFRHDGYPLPILFSDISCRTAPLSVHIVRSNERCFNNALLVDVGYQVNDRFLKVFTSCHDPVLETNYYASYQMTPLSITNQQSQATIAWRQLDFFPGKNVNNLMSIEVQRQTVATILDSQEAANFFIQNQNSQIYLARGHMAARTDFILLPEQRATFTFINAAPQYQTFNALNWEAVELSTRRLAADRNLTLDTYTGTHGVTHFWNAKGDRRKIFIGWPFSHIPVPMIYYRIIIDRASQSGIAFIGVNNIFLTLEEIYRDYLFCSDIGHRVTFVNWSKTNISRGYMYACDVNDFLRNVPHIQGLTIKSLLL